MLYLLFFLKKSLQNYEKSPTFPKFSHVCHPFMQSIRHFAIIGTIIDYRLFVCTFNKLLV